MTKRITEKIQNDGYTTIHESIDKKIRPNIRAV